MRKRYYIIIPMFMCLAALSVLNAQIPNAGFENWTAGAPNNWWTNNALTFYTTVTQTTDARSGTYALQGTVVTYVSLITPIVTGEVTISARYGSLKGYYKYSPVGGDSLEVIVWVFKDGVGVMGAGHFLTGVSTSTYTQFTASIDYFSADVPDSAWVQFAIISNTSTLHAGSTFKIDDLSFGPVTSVPGSIALNPGVFELSQNYPNPFNPSTRISYQIPSAGLVHLEVCDMLGRTLATLVKEQKSAGQYTATFDGSLVPSGVYFYRINMVGRDGKSFSQTKKMILTK